MATKLEQDAALIGAVQYGKGWVIAKWSGRNAQWTGYAPNGRSELGPGYLYTYARTLEGLVKIGVPVLSDSTVRRRAAKRRAADADYEATIS